MPRPAGIAAAALVLGCSSLLGCTTAEPSTQPAPPSTIPAASADYSIELLDLGAPDRHPLAESLPVGRTSEIVVSLGSLGETVDVSLDATLLRSGASGGGQLIELVVVGVDAGDPATVEGLMPIVGASSRLVRDQRLAVVEQELDVPADLAFRADAVLRQALRAPFVLAGPVVTNPVGSGASWTLRTIEAGLTLDTTTVHVVSNTIDGYVLQFDLPEGRVEISGRSGELLPDEQLITLDNATLRVVARRVDG